MKKSLTLGITLLLILSGCTSNNNIIDDEDLKIIDENEQTYVNRLPEPVSVAEDFYDIIHICDYHAFYKDKTFTLNLSDSLGEEIHNMDFINRLYWSNELINGVMGVMGKEKSKTKWEITYTFYENAKNSYRKQYNHMFDAAYNDPVDGVLSENTFVSDTKEVVVDVYSSQQLWYAVEHNYKPNPLPSSPAETYYNAAKALLNDLIEPSDDELTKIRKIYDHIAHSCVYDYGALNSVEEVDPNFPDAICAQDKAFFLEGFFDNHLVVCDGFSKIYTLLGKMVGIDIYRGSSCNSSLPTTKDNVGHAYCLINYNNKIYTSCPTWSQRTFGDYIVLNHMTFLTYNDMLSPYNDVNEWEFRNTNNYIQTKSQYPALSSSNPLSSAYNYQVNLGEDYGVVNTFNPSASEVATIFDYLLDRAMPFYFEVLANESAMVNAYNSSDKYRNAFYMIEGEGFGTYTFFTIIKYNY